MLKVGDEVDVKLLEIDEKTGKMRLSMRALQPKPEGYVEPVRRPRPEGGRGGFGGHDRRDYRGGDRDDRRGGDDRRSGSGGGYGHDRRDGGRRDSRFGDDRGPRRDFHRDENTDNTPKE